MQTRTHLTTPPGQEPAGGSSSREEHEVYVPALGLPDEPRPPGRFRAVWITLASVIGLVAAIWLGFQYAQQGQDFDPALDPAFQQELPQDPAEPAPGLDTGDSGDTEDAEDAEPTLPGEGAEPTLPGEEG